MSRASLEAALPASRRILLDTSTVLAHLTGTETVSPVATHIIDEFVATGRNAAIVSVLTVLEVLVEPLRRGDTTLYQQINFFLRHTRNLRVAGAEFGEAQEAARLRATYAFKTPDALIIATGLRQSVAYLVCNDKEWKQKWAPGPGEPAVCYLRDYLPFP